MTRTLRRCLAALAVAVFAVLFTTSSASAHSKLVASDPANGAVLSAAPSAVTFTFDENLLQGTNTISVSDDTGQVVASTRVEPDGNAVSAPWPAAADHGVYQAAYRIVSADGHPVTGYITVTVGTAAASVPASVAASAAASDVPRPAPLPLDNGTGSLWLWVLVVGVVLTAVAVVVAGLSINRRRRGPL